jgi:hypothetical protein
MRHFRLLFALAGLLVAGAVDTARAQSFTIGQPAKTLCIGTPQANPATCTTANVGAVPAFQDVFYKLTFQSNTFSGSVDLLETFPLGFNFLDAKCTIGTVAVTWPPLTASVSGIPPAATTTFSSLSLSPNQTVICSFHGFFSNPGMGVANTVAVKDKNGPGSISAGHNATVANTVQLPDLSVTKTASPTSINVSGGIPQAVTYTITIKNNSTTANVYLGPIFQLADQLAIPSSGVPLQVQLNTAIPVQCTPLPPPGSPSLVPDCLNPVPAQFPPTSPPWTDVQTTAFTPFLTWKFPAPPNPGAAGYIPAGGTITLTYQLLVQANPNINCIKMPGGDKLRNQATFNLTQIPGVTITEQNPNNNTATSADVSVFTGAYVVDPDCGGGFGPPAPAVDVLKKQNNPPSSTIVNPWGTPIDYRITVKNITANPIKIRLRDIVTGLNGTPPFTATVVSQTCTFNGASTTVCQPTVTPPTLTLGQNAPLTMWDQNSPNIQLLAGDVLQLDITLRYDSQSCDSFSSISVKTVRNTVRVKYDVGPQSFMVERSVDTLFGLLPECKFVVDKKVITTPNKIVFGQPFEYLVTYTNNDSATRTVGTLIDAIRIVNANYATQLPFSYSHACKVTAGSITGSIPAPVLGGTGTIVHTTYPSQGARIIQNTGFITFGPYSTLECRVGILVKRPPVGDPYCLSSIEPQLENLALMDVSQYYNANLPWPPSGTYSSGSPNQPSPLTNWHTVTSPLPKCYKLLVNKSVDPPATWTPGGPAPLTYTITLTNAGDTLTGTFVNNVWTGPMLSDLFLPGSPYTPTSVNVTSSCSNPAATWYNWTGPPAANQSFLQITSFPAGCSIKVTFTLPGPFTPGQICNRASVVMNPQGSPDWYANDPNPAIMQAQVCPPVWDTNTLSVLKLVTNKTGVSLSGVTYPVQVICGAPFNQTIILNLTEGIPQTVPNIPVGTNCTVTELTPVGTPTCPPPAVAGWAPPVYAPGQNAVILAPPAKQPTIIVRDTFQCTAPPTGSLTVSKTVYYDSTTPLTSLPFPIEVKVVCTPPLPNPTLMLTGPTMQQVMQWIPVGSVCTIDETPPPLYGGCGWITTYPAGPTVTIQPGNQSLQVINNSACGLVPNSPNLHVYKLLEFQGPSGAELLPTGLSFDVQIKCTPNTVPAIQNVILNLSNQYRFDTSSIVVGDTCKIYETIPSMPASYANRQCHWDITYWNRKAIDMAQSALPVSGDSVLIQYPIGTSELSVHNKLVCLLPPISPPPPGAKHAPLECRSPMTPNAAGSECVCPQGTVMKGRECVPRLECRSPMTPNAAGSECVCPQGTVMKGRECVPRLECREPAFPNRAGTECICPPRMVMKGRECVRQIECREPAFPNRAGTECICPPRMVMKGRECVRMERGDHEQYRGGDFKGEGPRRRDR